MGAEWSAMQSTLVCVVESLKEFRDDCLSSLEASSKAIHVHTNGSMLEDVTRWVDVTSKHITEQRSRALGEVKDESIRYDGGFAMSVHLVDHDSVEELVRCQILEEDNGGVN